MLFEQPGPTLILFMLIFTLGLVSCGEKERGCGSDYDCEEEFVCEPAGCRQACQSDGDCFLGEQCAPRRVEEGLVCTPPRP